ncbi:hypothetical protein [Flavobacterium lacisediminis]|uniref:Tetratricopeptide repeat-containing protein n=1 Tax=Flavobacterium lacisediminis TaxID=2989705 RepID=A0ABT3EKX2_9FLAO|nr:hypothetical protein [Flavobacterium lacisediminis]MCW1149224.1 hypothetical protein [Flavobacterium lacisediminis]
MKTIFFFMFLLTNNFFAQSQTLNDSVAMGLKQPQNIEELKKEILKLLNDIESIAFWGEAYHKGCKLGNQNNIYIIFKGKNEVITESGFKYSHFDEKGSYINHLDSIYFSSDSLLKFESRNPFRFTENNGVCCKCGKKSKFYEIPAQTFEIKLNDIKLTYNGSIYESNKIYLWDSNLIPKLTATARTLRLTISYNKEILELKDFEKEYSEIDNILKNQPVSENQRKYIVQANALAKEKKLFDAITQMKKALEINKFNFPDAYYNLSLLSIQSYENYEEIRLPDSAERCLIDAIFYLKKYLILMPNAEDARKAQDKIYEWEFKITHQ